MDSFPNTRTGTGSCSEACISGFPERDRLISDVFSRTGPSTRLIPDMRFVCNGTISGYTVALRRIQKRGQQHPRIQVWRRNETHCAYHKIGSGIPIDASMCIAGLTEVVDDVFDCDLLEGAGTSVQPGDILGLELPPKNNDSGVISFVDITKGPIKYVFEQQLDSPTAMLFNSTSIDQELPLITLRLEVESGKIIQHLSTCIRT